MAIRADSYGSRDEVTAYIRHLLDGQTSLNHLTRPTITEVEKFIDRASGILNMSFRNAGFAPSAITANSTAKLLADDWVVNRAAAMAELTQRGTGFDGKEGSRTAGLLSLNGDADEYVKSIALGLKREGIAVGNPVHQGLTFTAFDKDSERSDPDSTTLEQPKFKRGLFDS